MFRLFAATTVAIFLIMGCDDREKNTGNHVKKNDSKVAPARRDETETNIRSVRRSPAIQESASNMESVENLLADCERLKLGDGTGSVNITDLNEAYKKLAMADPELVLEQFANPDVFFTIGPALRGAVEVVAKKDPELLVNWLQHGLSKYEDRNRVIPLISLTLSELAKVVPEMALATFKSLNIPAGKQNAVIGAMFRAWGTSDPSSAINAASSLDPSLVSAALAGAAAGAIKSDPKMATTIAGEIADPAIRQGALSRIFGEWFKTEPRLAKDELLKLDPKMLEEILVDGAEDPVSLTSSISKSDPLTLLSLLDGIYPTSSNRELFERCIIETVGSQPDKTFSTISKLPEGELKSSLYGQAYGTLSRVNPERALSMFSKESDPALRATALPSIAASIGVGGMDETIRFVGGLKSDEEKSAAFSAAFNAVCHSDLESAANYLIDAENQSVILSSQERERGYKVVAFSLAANSLDDARDWMSELPSENQPDAMVGIATQIAERDAKGLAEYLNSIKKDKVWAAGVKVLISQPSHRLGPARPEARNCDVPSRF